MSTHPERQARNECLWRNWVGNQSFRPREINQYAAEEAIVSAVRIAARTGEKIRVPGSGHSFTPIVETEGTLANLDPLRGIVGIDAAEQQVTAWGQTTIAEFGDALWEHRLALSNQGDIDTQAIAGAIATGTHGSGIKLGSFSSTVSKARIVNAAGDIQEIDASDQDLLRAFQTSIGMLGIVTQVTLKVSRAYYLHEQIKILNVRDVLANWDDYLANYRHFSFFWMPSKESAQLYGFTGAGADTCMVKLYREVEADFHPANAGDRVGRSYQIYPHVFEPNFHELEYFLPIESAKEVFQSMRELMLRALPISKFPLEVRFVAADEGWLSPNYQRHNVVMSVSGEPGTDYGPYLRAVDAVFNGHDGRPHWGKLHFMTSGRLQHLFPRYDDFKALRRRADPNGIFLNDHLGSLFA